MKKTPHLPLHLLFALPLLGAVGCGETIDESGDPIGVGSQRRTVVEVPCQGGEDDCTEPLVVDDARSKDDDVIDVVDFGEGFVLVEGVGEGETKVIAKGDGERVRITYLVEADGAGGGDLNVTPVDIEVLTADE